MEKKVFYAAIVAVGLMLIFMAFHRESQPAQDGSNCELSSEAFKRADKSGAVILDVRTLPEYNSGHLKGAVCKDVTSQNFAKEIDKLDKDTKYFVYCKSGYRSSKAVAVMRAKGFENVCNLQGGVRALAASGIPLEK